MQRGKLTFLDQGEAKNAARYIVNAHREAKDLYRDVLTGKLWDVTY